MRYACVLLMCLWGTVSYAQSGVAGIMLFDTVMSRIRAEQFRSDIEKVDRMAGRWLNSLSPDGSFADVPYEDRSQTHWPPITHLNRLHDVVLAYISPQSSYYGNPEAYDAIVRMFRCWYQRHSRSTNWYMQQIAVPQRIGPMLIMMRSGRQQLPADLERQLLERMEKEGGRPDQPGSLGSGANKIDIATHWIYRGCLLRDSSIVSFAVSQVYQPLHLTFGEGLQPDFSYHQHGNQLYIGGYGDVFIGRICDVAGWMQGTPFALSGKKLELLSRFVREAYIPVVRGAHRLYNIKGRSLARSGSTRAYQAGLLRRMAQIDTRHAREYMEAARRWDGLEVPSWRIVPFNRHYWRSDYTLHVRPQFTFDVRMASTEVCRNENGNGENLLGFFLSEGATQIAVQGDEYDGIFPVWDWTLVPGVTAPAVSDIPRPHPWGQHGSSLFAGGVSDGSASVTAYQMNDSAYHIRTSANKAWFCLGDEVVCLGAGITGKRHEPVRTSVNQCLLKGEVVTFSDKGYSAVKPVMTENLLQGRGLWHNGVGYYFPEAGRIVYSCGSIQGSWKQISSNESDRPVKHDVFKLWIDHGSYPLMAGYAYVICPQVSAKKAARYKVKTSVDANTDTLQAVSCLSLQRAGAVFYQPGHWRVFDLDIETENACVLLLRKTGRNRYEVHVADPSRRLPAIRLRFRYGQMSERVVTCRLQPLPSGWAGSSVSFMLNSDTPATSVAGDTERAEYVD